MTRDRKGTYAGKLFVECTHTITTNKPGEESKSVERKYPAMGFGYIPIMVKSDYCPLSRMSEQELCDVGEDPYDLGGYLIAGGVEKVLIGQERMQNNFPFVFKKTSSGNKPIYEAEVRSLKEMSLRPASLIGLRYKSAAGGPTVRITALPYLRQGQDIPLGVMFKALGILNDKDMCFRITNNLNDQKMLSILRATIREGNKEVKTQEEALNYIGMRTTNMEKDKSLRVQYVKDLLTRDLLPHMGDSYEMKSYYLGFMTQELLNVVIGRKEPVDRDNYGRKRVSHAGQLLGELFAQILQKVMKDLRGMLNKV